MNRVNYLIEKKYSSLKVKDYLSNVLGLSRREITRLKQSNGIFVNDNPAFLTMLLNEKDILSLCFSGKDAALNNVLGGDIDVLYEDKYFLIVNKPSGMVVHSSKEHKGDDLGSLLKKKYHNAFVIRPIGRLDKEVSGAVIFAKDKNSAAVLSKMREDNLLVKYYLGVIEGRFENNSGTLVYKLEKDIKNHKFIEGLEGKECVTHYSVLKTEEDYSLIKIKIDTGRTHQIRAGLSICNHPLVGDALYGKQSKKANRVLLHCANIKFRHPYTNREIDISAPMPKEFKLFVS